MTRNEVTAVVKELVGRNWSGIDTTIYETINSVTELFGNSISAVYDEELWRHTFTTTDVSAEINSYELPSGIKYILNATAIDTTGDENVYYEMQAVSPIDAYKLDRLDKRGRPGFYTGSKDISGSQTITWNTFTGSQGSAVGRVDRTGIPKFYWRVGNNCYIYPRVSSEEVGWDLQITIAVKPDRLTTDTSNTITTNYPYALAHFAAGILWGTRMGDTERANQHYLLAGQHLTAIATDQEISKLINMRIRKA